MWFLTHSDWKCWMNLNNLINLDLPSLRSIQLDRYTLHGNRHNELCSLTMRSMKMDLKWLNIDLPSLKSITIILYEGSFSYPRNVTLESISQYWGLIELDIPNLQTVKLPGSFQKVQSKSITSIAFLISFDFIHRCFFHSRWSCPNQRLVLYNWLNDFHKRLFLFLIFKGLHVGNQFFFTISYNSQFFAQSHSISHSSTFV